VVVVGLRELVRDVSGPDYPLSTDMLSSWRLLPRCLLLAWWLLGSLALRRNVLRQVSTFMLSAWREFRCYPLPSFVVLGVFAHGRTCRNLNRLLSETCRGSGGFVFMLLDTCLVVIGSSSLDLVVLEPCSYAIDARVKLETASTTVSFVSCVGETNPIQVGQTPVSDS
jgi:hypothetical protein